MKKFLASLLLAFTLGGCDKMEDRSAVADTLVKTSLAHCDTGGTSPAVTTSYARRLRNVFMKAHSEDLKILRDAEITVCLDSRVKAGRQSAYIEGVFYAAAYKGVLTVIDGSGYGHHVIESFTRRALNDAVITEAPLYGPQGGGRGISIRWIGIEGFDAERQAVLAPLATPPVKKTP